MSFIGISVHHHHHHHVLTKRMAEHISISIGNGRLHKCINNQVYKSKRSCQPGCDGIASALYHVAAGSPPPHRRDVLHTLPHTHTHCEAMHVGSSLYVCSISQTLTLQIQSFVHAFCHSCMHICIHATVHSFIHAFIHSFVPSLIHSFIPSFIPSSVSLFTCSCTKQVSFPRVRCTQS